MNRSYLFLLFIVGAGYLGYDYYSFYNDPTSELLIKREETHQRQEEIETKKKKAEEGKLFIQRLETKKAELRALVEQLSQMKQTLSENSDMPGFSKYLFEESKKLSLNLNSVTPGARVKQNYYEEIPLQISFSGMFVQIVAFLERIAQADRIVRVDSVQLRSKGGQAVGQKFVEIDGTLLLKTFMYQPTVEDEAGKEKPKAGATAAAGGVQ